MSTGSFYAIDRRHLALATSAQPAAPVVDESPAGTSHVRTYAALLLDATGRGLRAAAARLTPAAPAVDQPC